MWRPLDTSGTTDFAWAPTSTVDDKLQIEQGRARILFDKTNFSVGFPGPYDSSGVQEYPIEIPIHTGGLALTFSAAVLALTSSILI